MSAHPVNQIENLVGITVVHGEWGHVAWCGDESIHVTSDPYSVTCFKCLKLQKESIEENLRGNPISATFNAQYKWVLDRLAGKT